MQPNTSTWTPVAVGDGPDVQIEKACLSDGSIAYNVHYHDAKMLSIVIGAVSYAHARGIAHGLARAAWITADVAETVGR